MSDEVREARRIARGLIAIALLSGLLVAFLWVAAPSGPSPMFNEPMGTQLAIPLAGVAVYLVGLVWMIGIYRRSHLEPEPDEPIWRYRA